jgi:hypothetical protein
MNESFARRDSRVTNKWNHPTVQMKKKKKGKENQKFTVYWVVGRLRQDRNRSPHDEEREVVV